MNYVMALLAFITVGGYILILAWFVPEPDLIAVAVLVAALVAFDFVTSARKSDK